MEKTENNETYKEIFETLVNIFPEKIKIPLKLLPEKVKTSAQEIRVGKILRIICGEKIIPLKIKITKNEREEIFKKICGYSPYSFQEQLREGFLTFKGGHRIGFASSAVIENEKITNIKDITSMNIRIARQVKGCAEELWEKIKGDESGSLIVGPPSSGKTTLLRDLARIISKNSKVCIVDERGEIAGAFEGEIFMDVGESDVLNGLPKPVAMLRAVRCLSPQVIICDEIGNLGETLSVGEVLNSGVKIISSIHAKNEKELLAKPQAIRLLNSGAFETVIILNRKNVGEISNIFKVGELLKNENYGNNPADSFGSFGGNVFPAAQP